MVDVIGGFVSAFKGLEAAPQSGQVMMALGDLRFGVSTQEYHSLRTSISWRWAEKARYGRMPGLQYHGQGSITKTMNVTIVAGNSTDLEFLRMVQVMGDDGRPMRLVSGSTTPIGGVNMLAGGSDMGLWCLTQLDYEESNFLRDGTAILMEATITIKSYGDDEA